MSLASLSAALPGSHVNYSNCLLSHDVPEEYVKLCTELKSIFQSQSEHTVMSHICRYQKVLRNVLQVASELHLNGQSGCTLLHLMFYNDWYVAYELLLSFMGLSLSAASLHTQTSSNLYPIQFARKDAKIMKYVLFESAYIVHNVHLDMHLDSILNSNVSEEISKDYAYPYAITMLQLSCIYGSDETIKKASALYMYSKTARSEDALSPQWLGKTLAILANLGGNTLRNTCIKEQEDNLIDRLASVATASDIDTQLIMEGIQTICEHEMKHSIFEETGAKQIAIVKTCISLKSMGNLTNELEESMAKAILTQGGTSIKYVHSVLRFLLLIDPDMSTRVSLVFYMIMMCACPPHSMCVPFTFPLYNMFRGTIAISDDQLRTLAFNTFAKVQFVAGVPLIHAWSNANLSLDISNAHFYMLQSLKFTCCDAVVTAIMKQANHISTSSRKCTASLNQMMTSQTICRPVDTVTRDISPATLGVLVDITMDQTMNLLNSPPTQMDIKHGDSAIVNCLITTNTLEQCLSALKLMIRQYPRTTMYTVCGMDFNSMFLSHNLSKLTDHSMMNMMVDTLDTRLFHRSHVYYRSLHELICNSYLASTYLTCLTSTHSQLVFNYCVLSSVLLTRGLNYVNLLSPQDETMNMLDGITNYAQRSNMTPMIYCSFHVILASLIQYRYPVLRLSGPPDLTQPSSVSSASASASASADAQHAGDMDYNKTTTTAQGGITTLPIHARVTSENLQLRPEWTPFPNLAVFQDCPGDVVSDLHQMYNRLLDVVNGEIRSSIDMTRILPNLTLHIETMENAMQFADDGRYYKLAVQLRHFYYIYISTALVHCYMIFPNMFAVNSFIELIVDRRKHHVGIEDICSMEVVYLDAYMFFLHTLSERVASKMKVGTDLLDSLICEYMGVRMFNSPLFQYGNMVTALKTNMPPEILSPELESSGLNNIVGHYKEIMETYPASISSLQASVLRAYDSGYISSNYGGSPLSHARCPSAEFPNIANTLYRCM